MSLFSMLEISGAALSAERQRAEIVAANMANANTTHTTDGGPYRRKEVVFASSRMMAFQTALSQSSAMLNQNRGVVRVSRVIDDPTPPQMRYEPSNPDANEQGYVAYPNINPIQEMVDLMGATRAYELNASAVNASKQMLQQALTILQG